MNNSDKCLNLKRELINRGASLVDFADLNQLPTDTRDYQRFAISIAVALDPIIIADISEGPNKKYRLEYKRANGLLSKLADCAAGMLKEWGYRAIPKAPTNVGIDFQTYSTILPHKTVATRAGLGWIGKCALLVTKKYGAAIRLTTVLTDAELETAIPIDQSLCGDCEACVKFCPGGAPSGKNWNVNLKRDSFFDAFACASAARERAMKRINIDDTICGICISVCPWTMKYIDKETCK
jgi:epoxyqueuosine reductase QueG